MAVAKILGIADDVCTILLMIMLTQIVPCIKWRALGAKLKRCDILLIFIPGTHCKHPSFEVLKFPRFPHLSVHMCSRV